MKTGMQPTHPIVAEQSDHPGNVDRFRTCTGQFAVSNLLAGSQFVAHAFKERDPSDPDEKQNRIDHGVVK